MPPLPPWLNVSPADFLAAAQGGAALGQRIGQSTNQTNVEREKIAASERENSARVNAQLSMAAQRAALENSQTETARAVRDWELKQRLGMDHERLALQGDEMEQRQALALQSLDLGKSRLSFDQQKEANDLKKQADDKVAPVYRTVENQLVEIDPTTGTANSLFTAPFRPAASSALSELLRGATATGTNAPGGLPPKPTERVRVQSPQGKVGTISIESLDEALSNGYKRL